MTNQWNIARCLAELQSMSESNLSTVAEPGKAAVNMRLVLEMVLMFHRGGTWGFADGNRWLDIQKEIGMPYVNADATTRSLCAAVRFALGIGES